MQIVSPRYHTLPTSPLQINVRDFIILLDSVNGFGLVMYFGGQLCQRNIDGDGPVSERCAGDSSPRCSSRQPVNSYRV